MDRIDELLLDWWEWSLGFNPGTDYQAFDGTCAQFRSSRQWMEYDDLDAEVEWQRKKSVGRAIEPMIMNLDLRARVAVNTECRNMSDGARVWSTLRLDEQAKEYARAKAILCPMMVAEGLIEKSACKQLENA